MAYLKKFIPFILLFLLCVTGFAQSRQDLEQKRKKLLEDIELTNKLLEQTKETKASSLTELETLQKKIDTREALIRNIHSEINLLQQHISETNQIITSLESDLEELKEEYAKMIYFAYKNQDAYDKLLFLFSSKSFNEAYKRLRYLKRYAAYRKMQADLIKNTKASLSGKITDLEVKREQKKALLNTIEDQSEVLNKEKEEKDDVIKNLQKKEQDLLSDLKAKQQAAERLNKAIEDIIRKEMEAARKRAEEAARSKEKKTEEELALKEASAALSENFVANKGKLPWPVDQGVITSTFGEHNHPVLSRVKIMNNGVDIKTTEGAGVKTIFSGTVVGVIFNPSFQKAVIISHGEYYTVYSNLKDVKVKKGDVITTGQQIGSVYTNSSEGKTEIHLEVWQGEKKLNPALWIYND